ncbi:AAA family ATPase [Alloyangia pacifica]|uniref:AAA family ATPase n=1 Tax=Alloyangia pacifica TaxID=311180 RepID=UPI001CD73F3A|nr:AAA family ATPase [Alloyangia pacifica]MCA0995091.1 AAA family ATPase [Alloyangia pacifica]
MTQAVLRLLGGYELQLADGTPLRLTSRKSFALLAILAQRADRAVPREEIATLLWGDRGEEQARASLRQELSVLRRALSRYGLECIEASKEAVLLDSRRIEIDTQTAEALIAKATPEAAAALAEVYQGDFLSGLDIRSEAFEDWRRLYREQLRDRVLDTLHEALLDDPAEPDIARALLRIDETHEEAHRALMRHFWQTGRRGEALQQYQRCLDALRRELDAEPDPDTIDLFEEIRDTTAPPVTGRSTGPLRPGGSAIPERRQLTVAVLGFALPEDLDRDPESLSALLADFAAHCRDHIGAYGGKIIDQADGRMIALFGHPRAHEADAERAVMAALGLLEQPFRDARGRALALRAGLAMGETLVGQQGSEGTVVSVAGPAVMTASRIELQAAPGETRIAGAMQHALRGQFRLSPMGDAASGAQVQRVLGESHHTDRFFISGATRQLTRLTGREEELHEMLRRWRAATQGETQVVALRGESGIGKSRLLSDFKKRALTDAPRLLQFSGSPHHQKSALFPLVQHLQEMLGFADLPDDSSRRARLRHWLERRPGLDLGQVEQVLSTLLGLSSVPDERLRDQDALLSAITALLRLAASEGRPLLLIIEDMHWLDPTSQLLLGRLAQELEDLPLMMLGTSRQAEGVAVPKPPRLHSITLARLTPREATALVRDICPETWPESRIAEIVARSDGIPLYLEELVHTAATGADGSIPDSLQASLTARIDRLDGARLLLQQAAVIGRVFDRETLAALAGRRAEDLDSTLRELQKLDLVYRLGRAADTRYEFKHALVQEQAHQTILLAERAALHSRLGDILAAAPVPVPAERIARHFEQGGRPRDAIPLLETAGKQALRVAAHTEADAHFARAAELARGLPASEEATALELKHLLLRGPQLLALHGFGAPAIEANYARALKLADSTRERGDLAHVYWGLWSYYVVRADIATAARIAESYLTLCRELGDTVGEVAANYALGVTQYYAGDLPEALAAFREAVAQHRPGLHEAQIERYGLDLSVCARSYECWLHALCAAPEAARQASAGAIAAAEAHAHDFSMAFAHVFTGVMHHFLQAPGPALHHGQIAERLADRHGYAQWRAQAEMVIGYARDQQGDPTGAALLTKGTEAYLATGARLALPYARAWQAEIALRGGDRETAQSLLQQAREITAANGELYFEAELLRLSARCGGDPERLLTGALKAARDSGAGLLELRAARDMAARGFGDAALRRALHELPENATAGEIAEAQQMLATQDAAEP